MTKPGDLALCPDCRHHIDVHTENDGCHRCDCDLIRQGVVARRVAVEIKAAETRALAAHRAGTCHESDWSCSYCEAAS